MLKYAALGYTAAFGSLATVVCLYPRTRFRADKYSFVVK
jgi:hypothetical protein